MKESSKIHMQELQEDIFRSIIHTFSNSIFISLCSTVGKY